MIHASKQMNLENIISETCESIYMQHLNWKINRINIDWRLQRLGVFAQ